MVGLVIGLGIWGLDVLAPVERRVGDGLSRMRGVEKDACPFVVVALDSATYAAWPEPTPAWGGHLAALISRLRRAGAKTIALDFVLAPDPRADEAVADANARLGEAILESQDRVVLGFRYDSTGVPVKPAEELRLAGAPEAFLDLPGEVDGVLRHGVRSRTSDPQSLAEVLAGRHRLRRPDEPAGVFTGDLARWKISVVSATASDADLAVVRGKTVVIGFAGPSGEDIVRLPVIGKRPGAEAQARLSATLWANSELRTVPLVLIVVGLLGLFASGIPWRKPAVGLACVPLGLAAAALAIRLGYVVPWVGPSVAIALSTLAAMGGQASDERRRRREIEGAFAYQIDGETLTFLLANPALTQVGAAVDVVGTVLFLDVRGSTAMGSKLPPEEFINRLNALFERLLPQVTRHGGVVLTFTGDGFLAVFGPLQPLENDGDAAVRAAVAMAAARVPGDPEIGIGLHRGPFVLGSLGAARRAQFTAIGDTVNLAARVESQTKEIGAVVLASSAVVESAPGEQWGRSVTFVPKNHPEPMTARVLIEATSGPA